MSAAAIAPVEATVHPIQVSAKTSTEWPLWQRVLFRFFFVYLLLQITPWAWFSDIPGVPFLLQWYQRGVDWAVFASNASTSARRIGRKLRAAVSACSSLSIESQPVITTLVGRFMA